ncbi:MAG: hypothetical protein HQK49_07325 [Oligoflexia bacterium]|nr:hypothetical protein [Oligoflexia bacterium]
MKTKQLQLLIIGIVLLATLLRMVGIGWGLPSKEISHLPFHCDETAAIHFLSKMDWKKGDFNPEDAHAEGTLSVYIWALGDHILKGLGILKKRGDQLEGYDENYRHYIIYGRTLNVIFELLSLWLIFLSLKKITTSSSSISSYAPYWGILIWAILPFEVIHSHYMRAHNIGNTLMLLIIYFSVPVQVLFAGLFVGLAAANRYTYLIMIFIPLSLLYLNKPNLKSWFSFDYRVIIILLSTLFGFFIGDMPLFLSYSTVKPFIEYQMSFSLKDVPWYDLSRTYYYIVNVIPQSLGPLWIIIYPAIFYGLFIKRYRLIFISFLTLIIFYLIPSTQHYPVYAGRLVLPLFPLFTIMAALMLDHLFVFVQNCNGSNGQTKKIYIPLTIIVGFIFITTTLYTWSIVYAMSKRDQDPYVQFYSYFKELKLKLKEQQQPRPKFGMITKGWDWFQPTNFEFILNSIPFERSGEIKNSQKNYLLPEEMVDYLIIYRFEKPTDDYIMQRMDELLNSNKYKLERIFSNKITFANFELNYQDYPHDFRYIFPQIYLLQKVPTDRRPPFSTEINHYPL